MIAKWFDLGTYQSSSRRSNPHSNLMLKIIREITIHTVEIRKIEKYKSQSRQENIGSADLQ